MAIHESAEDYLEKILMLKESKGFVRSIDIANLMGYSKPSISIAMKHLRESGYITMDRDNLITLTEQGSAVAERIYYRHTVLKKVLVSLGVDEETADHDACKIEHDISEESFKKLEEHIRAFGK